MNKPTVNVIEYFNNIISQVISFDDTEDGNKQAKKCFTDIVKEHQKDVYDIPSLIEDGIYEDDNGYQCFLVHSS